MKTAAGAPRFPSIAGAQLDFLSNSECNAAAFKTELEFGRASLMLEEAFARRDVAEMFVTETATAAAAAAAAAKVAAAAKMVMKEMAAFAKMAAAAKMRIWQSFIRRNAAGSRRRERVDDDLDLDASSVLRV
jgi:hypothetical protein